MTVGVRKLERPVSSLASPRTATLVTSLCLAAMHMAACAPTEFPQWFDGIHRTPLRQVQVEGQRIAYLDEGSGPPLILIHGFGGSMWQWEYQSTALAQGYRVITLDLLGSGWSDKPDLEYRPDQVLSYFVGFMDALGLSRATLIGNSMGAGVALGMALRHPERVDRLVLISGLPARVKEQLASPLVRRALESSLPTWLIQFGSWFVGSAGSERVLREIVFDHSRLTESVLSRSARNRQRHNYLGPILAVGRTLPLWETTYAPRLNEIHHRTLVIWGEHDRVFPPHVGQDLAATLTEARLVVIPQAGHIPMWERPDLVNPVLVEFLARE